MNDRPTGVNFINLIDNFATIRCYYIFSCILFSLILLLAQSSPLTAVMTISAEFAFNINDATPTSALILCFDKCNLKKLNVVLFGNSTKMFSYKNIINNMDEMLNHDGYSIKCNDTKDVNNRFQEYKDGLTNKNSEETHLSKAQIFDIKTKWLDVTIFQKESNRSASRFKKYYINMIANSNEVTIKDLENYEKLEQTRWNRFHMEHGWIFAQYSKDEKIQRRNRKEHNNLCPYDMIDEQTKSYDLVNIKLSYDEKDKIAKDTKKTF